jgi:hypothetical protein
VPKLYTEFTSLYIPWPTSVIDAAEVSVSVSVITSLQPPHG